MKIDLSKILICLFVFTSFACRDNSSNPASSTDETGMGKASNYYALRTGNRWSYSYSAMATNPIASQFTGYSYKYIVGDTLRHQDGNLLYTFSAQVAASIPYTVVTLYAPTDSGVLCYRSLYDSVLTNNKWTKTNSLKIHLLMDPMVVGHSWSAQSSDSTETYEIVSISQQVIGATARSVICVVRNTSASVDTSWFAKDYGMFLMHSYSKGTNPLQGYVATLDSCCL
jgi:hypothetical protein